MANCTDEVYVINVEEIAAAICECAKPIINEFGGGVQLLCSSQNPGTYYLLRTDGNEQPFYVEFPSGAEFNGYPADGIPCPDTKLVERELCIDGDYVATRLTCLQGSAVVAVFYLLADGTVSDTPPAGSAPCTGDCDPAISSYTGDALALTHPYNVISVSNMTCCAVEVTTDIGSFVVPPMSNYASQPFECMLSAASAAFLGSPVASCILSNVYVTIQKTK